jgi:hypothetical protein
MHLLCARSVTHMHAHNVSRMDLENIKNLTIGDEGSTCTLTIKRDGRTTDLSLTRCQPEGAVNDARSAEVPAHLHVPCQTSLCPFPCYSMFLLLLLVR